MASAEKSAKSEFLGHWQLSQCEVTVVYWEWTEAGQSEDRGTVSPRDGHVKSAWGDPKGQSPAFAHKLDILLMQTS